MRQRDGVTDAATPVDLGPIVLSGSALNPFGYSDLVVGLAAVSMHDALAFVRGLPSNSGLAFILAFTGEPADVQDLDDLAPGAFAVETVTEGLVPQAERVYVVPGGVVGWLQLGHFRLKPIPKGEVSSPVDLLLKALSAEVGNRAVGVLLPGTRAAGAQGARVMVEGGGHIFRLSDSGSEGSREEGADAGPPMSLADSKMTQQIIRTLLAMADSGAIGSQPQLIRGFGADTLTFLRILRICKERSGIDFSGYRTESLAQRVARRIQLSGQPDADAYLQMLIDSPTEWSLLCDEMLVSRTCFFRDAELWEEVRQRLPELIRSALSRQTFRVWVPGCGTGQEAYTLGMLIDEELRRQRRQLEVKIFGTDVNQASINRAAEGSYSEAEVSTLSAVRLKRHFIRRGERWVPRPSLRRMHIFSHHDLMIEPPFIHLDLLSCRNLLMYIEPSAQRGIFRTFAKALDDRSLLVLGPVESVGEDSPHFRRASPGHPIFLKDGDPISLMAQDLAPLDVSPALARPPSLSALAQPTPRLLLETHVARALAQRDTLLMVIDGERRLVGMVGESDRYLRHAQGEVSQDVIRLAREGLVGPLTMALEAARGVQDVARFRAILTGVNGERSRFLISAEPDRGGDGTLIVVLEPEISAEKAGVREWTADERIIEWERELTRAQDTVHLTSERLAEAEQAHRATREMMMTANEELQSANEELHSVNQELFAVNAELQNKIDQLTELGSDVDNLLQSTRIATLFIESDLSIRKFTHSASAIFNLMSHDIGRPLFHITHRLLLPNLEQVLVEVVKYGETVEEEVEAQDGQVYLMRVLPYHHEGGAIGGAVLTFVDITRIKEVESALRQKETQLREVINLVPHQLFAKDLQGRFVLVNQTTADFYGVSINELQRSHESDLVVGVDQLEIIQESDRRVFESGERVFIPEEHRVDRDGQSRTFQTTKIPIHGQPGGPALLGISLDITDQKRAEAELRHRALYDLLTGLPNRALFIERLSHCIERLRRKGEPGFALLFLDLDSFKEINDTMGHASGDQLLSAVAQRLKDCARPGDTVARFGGDEFAILLEDVGSADIGLRVAERVHGSLQGAFVIQGSNIVVSTSVGLALPGGEGASCEALMQQADVAMYAAKAAGPGHTRVFSMEMSAKLGRILETRVDLHQAIEEEQLVLFYQPIMDLKERRLSGLEVLLRWNHPRHGLLSPDSFLPVARSAGLMCRIDEWVIAQACAQLRTWIDAYPLPSDMTMNVNVCGEHLQRTDLVDFFGELVKRYNLPRRSLVVELTESSVLHAPAEAARALERLRDMDIGVALDDFGTGYSSLNHLRQLPLGVLKVDRSFTSHLGEDQRTTQIVKTLVELAVALDLKVVAEGIERADQEDVLQRFGCQYGQGYLYARPMDGPAMSRFILESLTGKVDDFNV